MKRREFMTLLGGVVDLYGSCHRAKAAAFR
jgi:hypothetical protein